MDSASGQGTGPSGWHDLGDCGSSASGWAHHGVAVSASGRVVVFDAASDEVLVLTADGDPVCRWSSGLTEGHALAALVDADGECVWIADCGQKMRPTSPGRYEPVVTRQHGRVAKFTLDGDLVRELPVPPVPAYEDHRYSPTAVAVDVSSSGGSGRVWVADGYGQSLVHVFERDGRYAGQLGESFDCPHGLLLDRRRREPELYVADRGNARLQVYGLGGDLRRTVGAGVLNSPSALTILDDLLIVAELHARLAVFDGDDVLVGYVGSDDEAPARPGWPNAVTSDGRTIRPPLRDGRFNSPHGVATDAEGSVIVAEWLLGGRLTKLPKTSLTGSSSG